MEGGGGEQHSLAVIHAPEERVHVLRVHGKGQVLGGAHDFRARCCDLARLGAARAANRPALAYAARCQLRHVPGPTAGARGVWDLCIWLSANSDTLRGRCFKPSSPVGRHSAAGGGAGGNTIFNSEKRFCNKCKEISYLGKEDLSRWLVKNGYAVAYQKYSKKYLLDDYQ